MGIVARQSFKASISNYIGIFLGFLNLFILFPLFYSPHDLGAIRLLLESGAVISSFALLGTNYSINRYFPYFKTEDQRHNGFFFWAFALPVIGYAFILISLVVFKQDILKLFGADAGILGEFYPLIFFLVLFSLFQTVLETTNANHGRIAFPIFLREVVLRMIILIGGLLYYLNFTDLTTSVWIMVAAYGTIVIVNFLYLSTLTKIHILPDFNFFKKNKPLFRDALGFTAFLFLGGITGLVIGKIDFFMISTKKMLSDTAIYSIGFYLALLIEIPKRTIQQISTPIISQKMKDNDIAGVGQMYRQISTNQLLVASILFFFIWLNIDNLFSLMPKGDFYKAGKTVVFIIACGRLIDMVGSASGPVIANSKFYWYGLITFFVSITIAIAANLILIPIYGINGAALATFITFTLGHIIAIAIVKSKLNILPLTFGQLKILAVLLVFLATTLTGNWFQNPIIDGLVRTPILGIPMVYLLYKWNVSVEFNQFIEKYLGKIGNQFK